MKIAYRLYICGSLITTFTLYCAPPMSNLTEQSSSIEKTQKVFPLNTQKRTIFVTSQISKKSTGYAKFFKTWYPDAFTLKINGVTIFDLENPTEEDVSFSIPVTDNTIMASYTYEFRHGKRTGGRSFSFHVPVNLKKTTISFSWKDEPRIEIKGASLVEPIQKV